MKAYQKRVIEEKSQLDDKIVKLKNFIATSKDYTELSSDEQGRLSEQLEVMERYSAILIERIKDFKK